MELEGEMIIEMKVMMYCEMVEKESGMSKLAIIGDKSTEDGLTVERGGARE